MNTILLLNMKILKIFSLLVLLSLASYTIAHKVIEDEDLLPEEK